MGLHRFANGAFATDGRWNRHCRHGNPRLAHEHIRLQAARIRAAGQPIHQLAELDPGVLRRLGQQARRREAGQRVDLEQVGLVRRSSIMMSMRARSRQPTTSFASRASSRQRSTTLGRQAEVEAVLGVVAPCTWRRSRRTRAWATMRIGASGSSSSRPTVSSGPSMNCSTSASPCFCEDRVAAPRRSASCVVADEHVDAAAAVDRLHDARAVDASASASPRVMTSYGGVGRPARFPGASSSRPCPCRAATPCEPLPTNGSRAARGSPEARRSRRTGRAARGR